jgi:hypothetical protein
VSEGAVEVRDTATLGEAPCQKGTLTASMTKAEKACNLPRVPAGTSVHLLLVRQLVGLQEPEVEDLKGVVRQDVVDYVHNLRQGSIRNSGEQQIKHHSLAGDVSCLELASATANQGASSENQTAGRFSLLG